MKYAYIKKMHTILKWYNSDFSPEKSLKNKIKCRRVKKWRLRIDFWDTHAKIPTDSLTETHFKNNYFWRNKICMMHRNVKILKLYTWKHVLNLNLKFQDSEYSLSYLILTSIVLWDFMTHKWWVINGES